MNADLEPRERFVEPLRDWFVDELRHTNDGDAQLRHEPPARGDGAADVDLQQPADRRTRRWVVLANAAAVAAVLVGLLIVVSTRSEPSVPPQDTAAAAPTSTPPSPAALAAAACAAYVEDAVELPLGAPPDDVVAAADAVERRLQAARDQLATAPAPAGGDLSEAIRLLDDAIESAERLRVVAADGGDRDEIDRSVENVDLIVAAASRRLEAVAEGACPGLSTLRKLR